VQQLLRKLNGLSGKNTATPTADQKEIDGDVVREQQPDSDGGGESIRWSPTAQKRFRFPLPVWVVGGLSIVALTIASVFYVKLQGNHTAVTQKANAAVNNPSPAGTSPVIRNIEPPRLIKPSERPQRATVVDFQNLPGESGSRFTSYSEAGITVKTESGKWLVEKRGSAPYIYFLLPRESHAEAKATILVTAGGLPFSFSSADFYSSVTTIPYILTGKMAGQTVFLQSGIVPNTFGNFASIEVEDKYKAITVDMLEIQLSTFTEYAVGNPVGINNIILLMKG